MLLLGNWAPAIQMHAVLLSLQTLLGCPNPIDHLAGDVAIEWKNNEEGAIAKGRPQHLCYIYACCAMYTYCFILHKNYHSRHLQKTLGSTRHKGRDMKEDGKEGRNHSPVDE